MPPKPRFALLVLFATFVGAAQSVVAQVLFSNSGQIYSENFDTLSTTIETNVAWANNSTLPGWSLFHVTDDDDSTPVAVTTYRASTGTDNTGAFYAFGSSLSGDRALGGIGSGTAYFGSPDTGNVGGWIALALTNSTGSSLNAFSVSFEGEQWRKSGATSSQTMFFQYGFGATFGGVTTWISPGGSFDWASPIFTATAAALDGNASGNRVANLGGSVSNLTWSDGSTLWLRWIETNDSGSDHGLGIDNVSFTAVPEPSTYAAIFGLISLGVVIWRRRRSAA